MEVRRPFAFLPAIAWAVLIDALDLISNAFTIPLIFLFGSGLGFDLLFDFFQNFIELIIFEDYKITIFDLDYILPAGLDVFPSNTLYVLLEERGII